MTVFSNWLLMLALLSFTVALLDVIHEHTARRWTRAVADFVVLIGFMLSVAFAFGGPSAVIEILTH